MDMAQLEASFQQNRVVILGAAGAGVVGLALYRRSKSKSSSSSTGTTTAGGAIATADPSSGVSSYFSSGGQLAGMNGAPYYDSSASDVYGAIQPALESLGSQLTNLQNQVSTLPVPAPAAPAPAPAPVVAAPAIATPAAPAPQVVPVAAAPAHQVDTWYTVQRGDTLSGIAARYPQQDITAATIGAANGIANLNRIYAGQRLHIVG